MLETVGVDSLDVLFEHVPDTLRDKAGLNLPDGLGEQEVLATMEAMAGLNAGLRSFQGAGCYAHFVPAVVGALMRRPEFATAYTPYQPEVSQGTLQAGFEFQTYVSILTGLDVANASLYDGASALAEAGLMALRAQRGRRRILVSAGVHPEYREVLETYLDGYKDGLVEEVPLSADGRTDLAALEKLLGDDVAAVCIGYPNFFGVIDDVGNAARLARRHGAVTVSVTAEALALALLRSPGDCGADVAVAEGQSLGLPRSYGGPGLGLFATRRRFVRQMPGRLVGQTTDGEGRRGYVLTLATREQHIRRDKATSNICTNQGLAALGATVFLGLAGRRGLRALAEANAKAAYDACERLTGADGVERVYDAPFFNEFVVRVKDADAWFASAMREGVIPGVRLNRFGSGLSGADDCVLVTVTEVNSPADVDTLVETARQREAA